MPAPGPAPLLRSAACPDDRLARTLATVVASRRPAVLQRQIFWIGGRRYDAPTKAAALLLHQAAVGAPPVPAVGPAVAPAVPPALAAVQGVATPVAFAGRRAPTAAGAVHLGVGEQVPLTVNGPPPAGAQVQWQLISGDAEVTDAGGNGTLTAGPTAGEVVIALQVAGGPHDRHRLSTHRFKVVAPDGATTMQRPGTNVRHTTGTAGAGFKMFVNLLPVDVPFERVQWREDFGLAFATGEFASENGRQHAPTGLAYNPATLQPVLPPPVGGREVKPRPTWMDVSATAPPLAGVGPNFVMQVDTVDTGDRPPSAGPPAAWSASSHVWDITWMYRVRRSTATGFSGDKELMKARHEGKIDANGRATIEKAGAGPFTKQAGDPTSAF